MQEIVYLLEMVASVLSAELVLVAPEETVSHQMVLTLLVLIFQLAVLVGLAEILDSGLNHMAQAYPM